MEYEIGSPEDLLIELSTELQDIGLFISFLNDNKFNGKFYLSISDDNRVLCKNYPVDDMDWLYNKPELIEFYNRVEYFGLVRGVDYLLYGGGVSANLVFSNKNVVSYKK
jgi:hypothetical protein